MIIILYIFLIQSQVVAQRDCNYIKYKKSCNKAYISIIRDSSYSDGIKHLIKVEKKYGFLLGEEYMLKAYAYKKIDSSFKCAENVKLAWSNYSLDWNYFFEIPELSPSKMIKNFDDKEKILVNEGYDNFSKLKKSPFADSILNIINSMDSIDAVVRHKYQIKKSERNGAEIIKIDSLNGLIFKEIVKTYGFPGEKFSPGKSSACFRLILHFSDYPAYFKEMNPIFLKEVKEGRMPPTFYLYWLDRHHVLNERKSKFCMYLPKEVEIKSISKVNKRRLKFGVNYGFPKPPKAINYDL